MSSLSKPNFTTYICALLKPISLRLCICVKLSSTHLYIRSFETSRQHVAPRPRHGFSSWGPGEKRPRRRYGVRHEHGRRVCTADGRGF